MDRRNCAPRFSRVNGEPKIPNSWNYEVHNWPKHGKSWGFHDVVQILGDVGFPVRNVSLSFWLHLNLTFHLRAVKRFHSRHKNVPRLMLLNPYLEVHQTYSNTSPKDGKVKWTEEFWYSEECVLSNRSNTTHKSNKWKEPKSRTSQLANEEQVKWTGNILQCQNQTP